MAIAGNGFTRALSVVLAIGLAVGVSTASSASAVYPDGVPLESSTEEGAAQERFAVLVEALEAIGEDVILDMSWHRDHGRIVVSPEFLPIANMLADESGVEIVLTSGNGMSLADQVDLEFAVMQAVAKVQPRGGFSTRYDAVTNQVLITVHAEPSGLSQSHRQALASAGRFATHGLEIGVAIETTGEEAPVPQSTTQGGENYSNGCTGGFVGNKGTGYGIITARHCTVKPSKYDGDTTGNTFIPGSASTTQYDLRFTSLSGGTPENKIRIGASTFRTITSTGTPSVGLSICKYGKTTGYTCGMVAAYHGCTHTGGSTYACGLYKTTTRISEGGDSGGPWFFSNRAYGIHYGATSTQSYFTSIGYVSQISGVTVKTS